MRRLAAAIFLLCALFTMSAAAQGDLGLCPYNDTTGRPPLLPRYEAYNQRLVLVDWTTGADHLTLESGLAQAWTLGWSADCRYLAAAVGSSTSMDTVVWDTVTGANMGRVPDARGQAHHITWGPGNLLMVETRSGAIIWNVPAGSQITLDVPFHTVQVRNFSRIRWDTENNQLVGNLAVGGRKVFDLTTGQEIALSPAAQYDKYQLVPTDERGVLLGGKRYDCRDIHWDFIGQERQIVIRANYDWRGTLAVVETNDEITWASSSGYSSDCRYASVILSKPDRRYETVIYDMRTLRRVAGFGEAYLVRHPFQWAPIGHQALIASKDGIYLWEVPSDTRSLLTDRVAPALSGWRRLGAWTSVEWDTVNNQIYMTLEADLGAVHRFNGATGQLIARYELKDFRAPPSYPPQGAAFEIIDGGQTLKMYSYYYPRVTMTLVDLGSGTVQKVPYEQSATQQRPVYGSTETVAPAAPINALSGRRSYMRGSDSMAGLPYAWRVERRAPNVPYDTSGFYDARQRRPDETIVIYEQATGETMIEIENPQAFRAYSDVMWSADGMWALAQTSRGYFAVDIANRTTVLLRSQIDPRKPYSPYWDFARGQIILNSWPGPIVYDLRTGEERKMLSMEIGGARDDCNSCSIAGVTADGRTLGISREGRFGLFDLDTLNGIFLDYDNYLSLHGKAFAISPDGQYAVVARDVVNVWNLTDLPANIENRDPVYRWSTSRVSHLRFIDNVTLEITTRGGDVFLLNVETGKRTNP
jgi:hypothetical protein